MDIHSFVKKHNLYNEHLRPDAHRIASMLMCTNSNVYQMLSGNARFTKRHAVIITNALEREKAEKARIKQLEKLANRVQDLEDLTSELKEKAA